MGDARTTQLDMVNEMRTAVETHWDEHSNHTRNNSVTRIGRTERKLCVCVYLRIRYVLGLQIIWVAAGIDGHFIWPGSGEIYDGEDVWKCIGGVEGVMRGVSTPKIG